MAHSIPFGARSTADQVLAGVDLTRKRMVVIGCRSGIGLETMKALVANGAHVIGLAQTLEDARAACDAAGNWSTPIACDFADFDSICSAADSIGDLPGPLDAIITTTELGNLSGRKGHCDIELQSIVEYIGHFALVNRLAERVRNNSGRIVMVCGDVIANRAPADEAACDDLGSRHFYEPLVSGGPAKSVHAIYAKELSRRLAARGVLVNSFDAGIIRAAGLKDAGWTRRIIGPIARLFTKSAAQRAATAALLAASPQVAGISGENWSNCQISPADPLLTDEIVARRLWDRSEQIVFAIRAANRIGLQSAAQGRAAVDRRSLIGVAD
jgi:NAD(P)-dependent dehydrogenase (short-subunit alcohol dehydrogenase family)